MKSLLVVCHNAVLRQTRVFLMEKAGYQVRHALTDDEAMSLLEIETFPLVIVGRNSSGYKIGLDQRIRQLYPEQSVLKIRATFADNSEHATLMVDSHPEQVLRAVASLVPRPILPSNDLFAE